MSSNISRADLNSRLKDLEKQLSNEKLLVADPDAVLQKAEELYSMSGSHETFKNWRQIAAYRLGHILFRESDLGSEPLERIADLFQEAIGDARDPTGATGFMPILYKIAANFRLSCLDDERASEFQRQNLQLFEQAINRWTHWEQKTSHGEPVLQSNGFNCLEIIAYFTSQDYSRLSGREATSSRGESWCLLSNRGHGEAVRLSKTFAHAELETNLRLTKSAFGLRQVDRQGNWQWRFGDEDWQTWEAAERANILALGLSNPETSNPEIARVIGNTTEAAKQAKSRLVKQLKKLLSKAGSQSMEFRNLCEQDAEIPVFLAIEARLLKASR